jgi:GMP synthase-like glutamine amidotransferase
MRRIKLGILQTNHDKSVEVGDAYPDDAHRFRDLFDAHETRFEYKVYMTIGGEVPKSLDEQDAFLITGSPLSVLDTHIFTKDLVDFVRACDNAKKPLIGACFGHQIIADALGGTVKKSKNGYNMGVEKTHFFEKSLWMKPNKQELPMYVFHEDEVTHLPEGTKLLGSTPNCKIASFSKGNHIFTTQAHPEFTPEFMTSVISYTAQKVPSFDPRPALSQINDPTEGHVYATWCTEFFKGGL